MRLIASLLLAAGLSLPAAALDLQAHRGGRGLAPENTLAAFERALETGVTTLELDVGITADGVLVVAHDPFLNPYLVRDAKGEWLAAKGPSLRSLTLAQVKTYDVGRIKPGTPYASQFASQQPRDGTRMPTLAEVFALVKARGANDVRFNIETKLSPLAPDETANPEVFANSLVNAIRDAGLAGRVTVQSFDWRTLQIVQGLDNTIPTAYLTIQTANTDNVNQGAWTAGMKLADHGSIPKMVKAAGGAIWSPNGGALKADDVKEAQALGLKVLPWTINSEADMDRLIGWGVDGIITDYPDRLREVMQKRGLALPKGLKN